MLQGAGKQIGKTDCRYFSHAELQTNGLRCRASSNQCGRKAPFAVFTSPCLMMLAILLISQLGCLGSPQEIFVWCCRAIVCVVTRRPRCRAVPLSVSGSRKGGLKRRYTFFLITGHCPRNRSAHDVAIGGVNRNYSDWIVKELKFNGYNLSYLKYYCKIYFKYS